MVQKRRDRLFWALEFCPLRGLGEGSYFMLNINLNSNEIMITQQMMQVSPQNPRTSPSGRLA